MSTVAWPNCSPLLLNGHYSSTIPLKSRDVKGEHLKSRGKPVGLSLSWAETERRGSISLHVPKPNKHFNSVVFPIPDGPAKAVIPIPVCSIKLARANNTVVVISIFAEISPMV